MGMIFKNIEYMNGEECFENLSCTSVPKSIGRTPLPRPGRSIVNNMHVYKPRCIDGFLNTSTVFCF
jgi:hypothetical protein